MHQQCLAGGKPAPHGQCEIHRQVVEQQPRARLKADIVRQREHPIGTEHRGIRHGTTDHGQTQDPVAAFHVRAIGCRAHNPRQFSAEGERQFRPVLIEPASEQRVGKCHPGGVHIDDDAAVGRRFVNLGEFQ